MRKAVHRLNGCVQYDWQVPPAPINIYYKGNVLTLPASALDPVTKLLKRECAEMVNEWKAFMDMATAVA